MSSRSDSPRAAAIIKAPLSGPLVPLIDVPDPVFAQKIVGDGISIDPITSQLLAPCGGKVVQLHRAGHAVTIAGAAIARDPAAAEKARGYVAALGGRGNIDTVTACGVTRLRVTVRDGAAVDETALAAAGASGVMHVAGPALHVIVGPHAAEYAEAISTLNAQVSTLRVES